MDNKKEVAIKGTIKDYEKLPEEKRQFVLGYMTGVLASKESSKEEDPEAETD